MDVASWAAHGKLPVRCKTILVPVLPSNRYLRTGRSFTVRCPLPSIRASRRAAIIGVGIPVVALSAARRADGNRSSKKFDAIFVVLIRLQLAT